MKRHLLKQKRRKALILPVDVFRKPIGKTRTDENRSSAKSAGAKRRHRFRFHAIASSQIVPGISQEGIAKRLGRSKRTISSRLSNENRLRKGLDYLPRVRVVRKLEMHSAAIALQNSRRDVEVFSPFWGQTFDESPSVKGKFIIIREMTFGGDRGLYQMLTNVYDSGLELVNCKSAQRRANRACSPGA